MIELAVLLCQPVAGERSLPMAQEGVKKSIALIMLAGAERSSVMQYRKFLFF
jgi:hypothetical protein